MANRISRRAILLSFGDSKSGTCSRRGTNDTEGRRQTPLLPQFRPLGWPAPLCLFLALSLSFLGSRISKSVAVKSAASLSLCLSASLSFCLPALLVTLDFGRNCVSWPPPPARSPALLPPPLPNIRADISPPFFARSLRPWTDGRTVLPSARGGGEGSQSA